MIIWEVPILLVLLSQVFADNNIVIAHKYIVEYTPYHEPILCRSCGHDISTTKQIISKASPYSRYSFYDTIFHNKQDVLVQTFTDLLLFNFPMITLSKSACSGIGEWEESTWFPGYVSRPCVCPECGVYIGFEYQPIGLDDSEQFFGFLLASIIGESFADSLIQHPKAHN